jgi:hypothetical protein
MLVVHTKFVGAVLATFTEPDVAAARALPVVADNEIEIEPPLGCEML